MNTTLALVLSSDFFSKMAKNADADGSCSKVSKGLSRWSILLSIAKAIHLMVKATRSARRMQHFYLLLIIKTGLSVLLPNKRPYSSGGRGTGDHFRSRCPNCQEKNAYCMSTLCGSVHLQTTKSQHECQVFRQLHDQHVTKSTFLRSYRQFSVSASS